MRHPLFTEIENYYEWSKGVWRKGGIGCDWESLYPGWYLDLFKDYLKSCDVTKASDEENEYLLYIIARDHEGENLVDILTEYPDGFLHLAGVAIEIGHRDARWQFARRLLDLTNCGGPVAELVEYQIPPDDCCESLVDMLDKDATRSPDAFLYLAGIEYEIGHRDVRKQLAQKLFDSKTDYRGLVAARESASYEGKFHTVLKLTGDGKRAVELLERYVNDPDEYVNRRALITMARFNCPNTEHYCKKFWESQIYDGGESLYQKLNALWCLKEIQSRKLEHYLELGKQSGLEIEDGGSYLYDFSD